MKNYTLPKEFTLRWIKALRSKKYKQGERYLCEGGKYCCLGVAAIISGVEESEIEGIKILEPSFSNGKIPIEIIGNASDKKLIAFLVSKNDGQRDAETNPNSEKWGFRKIADWIETNVELI